MTTLPTDKLSEPPIDLLHGAALFLDFDGTLVDLADSPDGVTVPDSLLALLACLDERLDGRMAIVSGRSCLRLDDFGLGDFIRAGSHGLEILGRDEVICEPERHADLDAILAECHDFAEDKPGVVIEPKPYSVGIHYRQAPKHAVAADALAEKLATSAGLFVQKGKLMAEIRPADGHKGKAIEKMMASAGFAGATPVFLGDDTTDEDGFETCRKLGGHGIFVGRTGKTGAGWRLDDVAAVRRWLETACDALKERRASV